MGRCCGSLGSAFVGWGCTVRRLKMAQPPFPSPRDLDLLVVLGGPASANDPYPALRAEERFLADVHGAGVPIFAVCLGAQLLSKTLGGVVEATGGYQFGLRKIHVCEAGSSDVGVR